MNDQHVTFRRFGKTPEVAISVPLLLESLGRDARFGLRILGKNPGFTTVAVMGLAIGISVNTTVFTVFDAVALRPLPVKDPERLVKLGEMSYREYIYYRDHARAFSELSLMGGLGKATSSDLSPASAGMASGFGGATGLHPPQLLPGSAQLISYTYISGICISP
jgi:hypothetical protein